MVMVEECGDGNPRVSIVNRVGMRIGRDASTLNVNQQPWVRKVEDPSPMFNPRNEKETYQEARK